MQANPVQRNLILSRGNPADRSRQEPTGVCRTLDRGIVLAGAVPAEGLVFPPVWRASEIFIKKLDFTP